VSVEEYLFKQKTDLIESQKKTIEQQKELIAFLNKRIIKLEEEKKMFKKALAERNLEVRSNYREDRKRLEGEEPKIMRVIADLDAKGLHVVSYDDVVKAFHQRYNYGNYDTISRRMRQLREDGWLFSPEGEDGKAEGGKFSLKRK